MATCLVTGLWAHLRTQSWLWPEQSPGSSNNNRRNVCNAMFTRLVLLVVSQKSCVFWSL